MEQIKIPRSLIYNKEMGEKRVIVYSSILFTHLNEKACSVNELVEECGYACKRMSNGVEQQFTNIIRILSDKRMLSVQWVAGNQISFGAEPPAKSFGIIHESEFERILNYRKLAKKSGHRINHAHLLLLLSYIRLNMEKQTGKPIMYYSLLKTISENIGLSVRSISAALKVLERLSIIHSEELPRYQDEDGNWHSDVRIFVNMEQCGFISTNADYDWQEELQRGIAEIFRAREIEQEDVMKLET